MWPWGHLAVAYLVYTAYAHRRFDRPPLAPPALALAVGSQFPDLIDKPLAWNFGVLPGGRTLSHSLLFGAALSVLVLVAAARLERRDVGIAFLIGHYAHLVADVPPSVLRGDLSGTEYFLWPLLEPPAEEPVAGLLDAILHYYELGTYEVVQFGLFAIAALVWYRDGMPGLAYVLGLPRRALRRQAS